MNMPRLHAEPTRRHARRWLRRTVRLIGPCFHPETPPSDYLDPGGQRLLNVRNARLFAHDLRRAEEVLGESAFETIGQTVQWQLLGVRFDPASEQLVEFDV